ncbi:MAG: dUTP diphosphatase [Patescibacteria group bacterium]
MILKVKKVDTEAKLPTHGHPGDAAVDLYCLENVLFKPGAQERVRTGIAVEIPENHVGLIWDKSSISFNLGLKIMGGVIDSGFRGEIVASFLNTSAKEVLLEKGQKFAQMIIQRFERVEIEESEELSDTVRGQGREGSTGLR